MKKRARKGSARAEKSSRVSKNKSQVLEDKTRLALTVVTISLLVIAILIIQLSIIDVSPFNAIGRATDVESIDGKTALASQEGEVVSKTTDAGLWGAVLDIFGSESSSSAGGGSVEEGTSTTFESGELTDTAPEVDLSPSAPTPVVTGGACSIPGDVDYDSCDKSGEFRRCFHDYTWSDCDIDRCANGVIDSNEECEPFYEDTGQPWGAVCDEDPEGPYFRGCAGSCVLVSECQESYCGDLIIAPHLGEECDDGNEENGDGCSSTCQIQEIVTPPEPECGNGVCVAPGEDCFTCSEDCGVCDDSGQNFCGNGVVDSIAEECDSDQFTLDHGITSGNPFEWAYSDDCETPGFDSAVSVCTLSCQQECWPHTCGDGFVSGQEQCDDGNLIDGDGCSESCELEALPGCGDGIVEDGEQCDPLAVADQCLVPGTGATGAFTCDILTCQYSECVPTCGNGLVQEVYGEQCDDGNTQSGDGCDSSCQVEIPPYCGDLIIQSEEECDDGLLFLEDGSLDPDNFDDACIPTCDNPEGCESYEQLSCFAAYCGDGYVWDDLETCIDLGTGESFCESCDDGPLNGVPGYCNFECSEVLDGGVETAQDTDDDGVLDDGDNSGVIGDNYCTGNNDQVGDDGLLLCDDNCPVLQNGPVYGVCTQITPSFGGSGDGESEASIAVPEGFSEDSAGDDGESSGEPVVVCSDDNDCAFDEVCWKSQLDSDSDGLGDICDACPQEIGDSRLLGCPDDTVDIEPPPVNPTGGDSNPGDGSGSGSGREGGAVDYSPEDLEISGRFDKGEYAEVSLPTGGKVYFNLVSSGNPDEEEHTLEVINKILEEQRIEVIVASEPTVYNLIQDEPVEVDLDHPEDGFFDIVVAYVGESLSGESLIMIIRPEEGVDTSSDDVDELIANAQSVEVQDLEVSQSPKVGNTIYLVLVIALAGALVYAIVNFLMKRRLRRSYLASNHPYLREQQAQQSAQTANSFFVNE